MNKENFSWIHYAYITITASVLAYVTYADNTNDESESESALDMLPGSSAIVSDEPVDTPLIDKPVPAVAEPIPEVPLAQAVVEPVPEATVPEASVPEASVPEATESPIAPTIENKVNGGKLKKTRTNNKKYKKKQTRSRH